MLKKLVTTIFASALMLAVSVPAFAFESKVPSELISQINNDMLIAHKTGDYQLIEKYYKMSGVMEEYRGTADVYDGDKISKKLAEKKLGPNDRAVIIMDDGSSFVATTTTKRVTEENGQVKLLQDDYHETGYEMSGTKWNTTYEVKRSYEDVLAMTAYYQIGSKMDIYLYDSNGTKSVLGTTTKPSLKVLNNKTKTATLQGTFTTTTVTGLETITTLYTEIGFQKAYQESDGYYYVDYYVHSWH